MKWDKGVCGLFYSKVTILKTKYCDISILKIMDGGYISPHLDNERQLRINIDLPIKHSGGNFICPDAYINFFNISVYRADKHLHEFKSVRLGTKYTISFGFYY